MDIDVMNARLKNGETLHCPECDHFTETEDCLIVCCDDPFNGPGKFEVARHVESMITYFDMQQKPRS